MELKKLLNMYSNVTTALMILRLANGEIVKVSKHMLTVADTARKIKYAKTRNVGKGIYPWIEMRDRFGEVKIKEFSVAEDATITFWEEGALECLK